MFNRRQLLIGTAATAAVISLPAIAAAPNPASKAVLDSVLKFIAPYQWGSMMKPSRDYGCTEEVLSYSLDVQINTRLITQYPELFPEDRHLFSGCPGNLFFNGKERLAACVGSRHWPVTSRIDLELMQDLKCIVGHDFERTYLNDMADKIASDMRYQQSLLAEKDHHMFSLIPAITSKWVNPDTYQPGFVFRSRYAVVPKDFHLMSAEEDQKIWNEEQRRLVG